MRVSSLKLALLSNVMARTSPTCDEEENHPCMTWSAASPRKRETHLLRSSDRRRRQLVTLLNEAIKRETTAMGGYRNQLNDFPDGCDLVVLLVVDQALSLGFVDDGILPAQ